MLVDHLVPGSKEAPSPPTSARTHVLVTGHPYVDIWQAVKPACGRHRRMAGHPARYRLEDRRLRAARLARPGHGLADGTRCACNSYADLEVPLLEAVEQLIDFVTAAGEVDPDDDPAVT